MLEHLKENWRQLKEGEPGRRFRDACDAAHERGRGGARIRLFAAGAGALLIVAGLVLIPAPGPGWAIVILGLALLATAWRPAASLLDWAEPRARAAWHRTRTSWCDASRTTKLAVGTAAALVAIGLTLAACAALGTWL
jgi:uncharacterized protein (TIGR02611 family)